MHRISASKMNLCEKCLFWAREDVVIPQEESSEAANAGTGKHFALELIAGVSNTDNVGDSEFANLWGCEDVDAHAIINTVECWLRPWIDSGSVYCELPLAYCTKTDTARELYSKSARDYSDLKPGEIPMTIDLFVQTGEATGLVVDYKTGLQSTLVAVGASSQLNVCALAVARAFGLDEVRIAYAIVADDGHARIEEHVLDSFDLAAIAENVRGIMSRLTANPQPHPGEHCKAKWCPAKRVCPATIGLAKATPEFAPMVMVIDDAETCAKVHAQIALAEEFLVGVKAAVKDYVTENGAVQLDDGSTLELVQKSRETLDIDGNDKAVAALKKALGDAFQRAVHVKVSTSKEAIKAATAQLAKGKERVALERAIVEELQTLNAVKLSTFETVEVVRDRKRKVG